MDTTPRDADKRVAGELMRLDRRLAISGVIIALTLAAPAFGDERRCGWLENPTPGNWFLKDRRGLWIISAQGGPFAQGVEKLPEPVAGRFVVTNGRYGYSCACLIGTFDAHAQAVTRIDLSRTSPLYVCRNDKALPPPF
jgi:Protein of unknown function (DUF4087)